MKRGPLHVKISIITVVLNNKEHIAGCIESVLGQNYKDLEYIVIDGGSTDGTTELIRKYEDRISRWITEPDKGIYDAMNKGIGMATGDVIGMLNADDVYYAPDVLETIARVMDGSSAEVCYSDLVYVDRSDLGKIVRYWKSCPFTEGLFAKCWVPPHPTFFARRSVYQKHGLFDLSYPLAADFELMARLLERFRVRPAYIPKVSVKMRLGGATSNSVANIFRQNVEIIRACKKNGIRVFSPLFFTAKFMSRAKQYCTRPSI
jgi:glycosyltransferase involved in cell wall biosynthesis